MSGQNFMISLQVIPDQDKRRFTKEDPFTYSGVPGSCTNSQYPIAAALSMLKWKRLIPLQKQACIPWQGMPGLVSAPLPGKVNRMNSGTLYRRTAFTDNPAGGNPAGVWIGDSLPPVDEMQRIAAEIGYSETAFVAPSSGPTRTVRYYSPEMEVPFCGHATIATGVVLGETAGDGTYTLATAVGEIPVTVLTKAGLREAALTSVEPMFTTAPGALVNEAISALGWEAGDLDLSIPPARAYAGAWHLVLAVRDPHRLASLNYDFENLKTLMLREGLTTLQLVWRESAHLFHSRNPFPVGGVVEDPATGAAAAALGGYLREARLIAAPATIFIRQGEAMGRPSRLTVEIPAAGGIVVRGTAVPMEDL